MYAFGQDCFGLSDLTLSAHFDCWFARTGDQKTCFAFSIVSIALLYKQNKQSYLVVRLEILLLVLATFLSDLLFFIRGAVRRTFEWSHALGIAQPTTLA
jgi:hypothetical protein